MIQLFKRNIIPQTPLYFAIITKKSYKEFSLTLTIIGIGSMAMAMAEGLKDHHNLEFVARNLNQSEMLKKRFDATLYPLKNFDISNKNIILAVKPYALLPVASQLQGSAHTLYSILAGTPLDALHAIKADYYIRTMPNVAAKFGASSTIITGDHVKKEQASEIFSAIGDTFWVESEKEIDIATAIAGSGPALLSLVAEAMMDGLVKEGMKRPDAMGITNSLFKGFAPLIKSDHPALIKDAVMSPGGTTAAAYTALEEGAVRASFINAVKKAFEVTQR